MSADKLERLIGIQHAMMLNYLSLNAPDVLSRITADAELVLDIQDAEYGATVARRLRGL